MTGKAAKEPLAANPDERERRQLGTVLTLVRTTLGEDVAGAWLHGSGGIRRLQRSSDLDILVLVRRRTTDAEKRALIDGLLPISGSRARGGPARSIDLSIVAEPDIRPWRYPPRLDVQYGDWLREAFGRGELEPWPRPNPDLAVLLTAVRGSSRPLIGPPAREALDPVPRQDLVRAMADEVASLLEDLDDDTRNVVLTLARIWLTLATGEIESKDTAATWALERLPPDHRPALAHARAIYLGQAPEDWSGRRSAVGPLVDRLVAEIRELAGTTRGNR